MPCLQKVSSSVGMELIGFKRILERSSDWPFDIATIATDRHIQVSKYMAGQHADISHQYDVWHMAKSIMKRLSVKAKTKACAELMPWLSSINNHFWWCAATCGGDAQLLR